MKQFLITSLVLAGFSASAIDTSGLQISLAGDMVYNQGLNQSSNANEKLTMRGAEMMFYAPLDHRFDGTLSAAAHDEDGETAFELHELYFSSSKIIPRTRLKVGQFFLGVGRINQVHQHDWPFISAPKVQEEFFAEEGIFDSGVEASYLFNTTKFLELTGGITSGHKYGHAHSSGAKPKVPTHYLSLKTFNEFSSSSGVQYALNYLGRTDEQDNKMMIPGLEVVAKWREGKIVKYLLQSELWYRNIEDASKSHSEQIGLYVFNQFYLFNSLDFGFRIDGFKDLSKRNSITGKKINNIQYGVSPELTWSSSEFVKMRAGLSHEFTREEGMTVSKDTRLNFQFIFILGAHPAHNF
jgi:hypothetical protein